MSRYQAAEMSGERAAGGETRQAGAIPYALRDDKLVFLLITSSSGRWIFPKGRVEAGEDGPACAAREAFEEAGVSGDIAAEAVSCFDVPVERQGMQYEAELCLYGMRVSDQQDRWPERGDRARHWVTFEELRELVDDPRYIAAANTIRESQTDT